MIDSFEPTTPPSTRRLASSTVYEDIRTTRFGVNPGEHYPQRYRQHGAESGPSSSGEQLADLSVIWSSSVVAGAARHVPVPQKCWR
jgi:hypothetical protein